MAARSALLEYRTKSSLLEMAVSRQGLSQAAVGHDDALV
jgi:hypothetical protein